MANKNPWEGKLFDGTGRRASRSQAQDRTSLIFTILLIIFAVIVTLMIGFSIYLSVGGSKSGKPSNAFYSAGAPVSVSSEPVETVEEPVETSESSSLSRNSTIEVQAGEGAGQIASRAGITIERLYELNPEHLQTGAWYANPGDVVYID